MPRPPTPRRACGVTCQDRSEAPRAAERVGSSSSFPSAAPLCGSVPPVCWWARLRVESTDTVHSTAPTESSRTWTCSGRRIRFPSASQRANRSYSVSMDGACTWSSSSPAAPSTTPPSSAQSVVSPTPWDRSPADGSGRSSRILPAMSGCPYKHWKVEVARGGQGGTDHGNLNSLAARLRTVCLCGRYVRSASERKTASVNRGRRARGDGTG